MWCEIWVFCQTCHDVCIFFRIFEVCWHISVKHFENMPDNYICLLLFSVAMQPIMFTKQGDQIKDHVYVARILINLPVLVCGASRELERSRSHRKKYILNSSKSIPTRIDTEKNRRRICQKYTKHIQISTTNQNNPSKQKLTKTNTDNSIKLSEQLTSRHKSL